ncbi:unnamed protein product [Bursaphelenchus xylophilus]|uniref:(pine wood nematode) hypothetical protein n=1 Tax=Bursaphelenchus xylophilus TaxID=6326 RepID=A0A1I7ST81_BURXY|nr:unnamed protein product [Bursaphelenchus xylophilus]CAG9108659.1 unnamed protein product [Bursaphelenchus xylophilus]
MLAHSEQQSRQQFDSFLRSFCLPGFGEERSKVEDMRSLITWFILFLSFCASSGFDMRSWNAHYFAPGTSRTVDLDVPMQKNPDEDNAGFIRPPMFSGGSASSSTRRLIQPPPLKRSQRFPSQSEFLWYRI